MRVAEQLWHSFPRPQEAVEVVSTMPCYLCARWLCVANPRDLGSLAAWAWATSTTIKITLVLIRTALNNIPLVADDPQNLQPFRVQVLHTAEGHLRKTNVAAVPYMVHRLDQSTSGAFVCAKNKAAAAALQDHSAPHDAVDTRVWHWT
eukprot:1856733-Amphidinium_carterae.1